MNKLTYASELAMVRSIFDLIKGDIRPGRLQNKYLSLQKEVDKSLQNIKIDQKTELPVIGKALELFADKTGWNNKKRSVGTVLSFTMGMIEESENRFNDKLLDLLNDIFEYHERKVPFPALCYSAGVIANEKWSNVKREVFNV